jgi:hypothetical protein
VTAGSREDGAQASTTSAASVGRSMD